MITLTIDMLTHVPEIDEQHRGFIDCLNALSNAIEQDRLLDHEDFDAERAQTARALLALGKYIDMHFAFEEELQEKYEYPKLNWHRELHSWYAAEFVKLKDEFFANGPSEAFMEVLEISMKNWIAKHITTADVTLGRYISERIMHPERRRVHG